MREDLSRLPPVFPTSPPSPVPYVSFPQRLSHLLLVPELQDRTTWIPVPMSFSFQEFSPGSTEHVQVRDRITSILQAYFYGVVYAPCIFLSLGKELERLRDCIEQIISENNNPNSVIFRSDNKLAAQKAVHLAIHGVHASLNDVENTLRTAKTHRGQTERWWTTFATMIRFNGGDKGFLDALENFRYHTWAFGIVLRILKFSSHILL